MQLTSAPPPVSAAAPPPAAFSARTLLPREMAVSRIGKGTVASEVDRSIRVLLQGEGPASRRELVPDSKAAADLFASDAGPTFERAMRSMLSVADAHEGSENLRSLTFLPDEHAAKGVSVLNRIDSLARAGMDIDAALDPTEYRVGKVRKEAPELTRPEIRTELRRLAAAEGVRLLTDGLGETIAFAGAWNGDGHVVMMPDVSRDMLATLGLYRIQPGDGSAQLPREQRAGKARRSWHAAIHEAHHSISPRDQRTNAEHTRVMEEAVAEVLTPGAVGPTIRRAGADPALAARPARDTKGEAVDWPAWNRDHLPQPDASEVSTAEGRYTDGPKLVRDLLRLAGIDRRTATGKLAALDLLQGERSNRVPSRLADAIARRHGLTDEAADRVTTLIRQAAIGNGTVADIRDFLDGTEAGNAARTS